MEDNKGQGSSFEQIEKLKNEISRLEEEVTHKKEIEELEQKKLELEAILNDQKEKAKNGDFDTSNINTNNQKTNFKKAENINFSIKSGKTVTEQEYYGSEIELAEEIIDGNNSEDNDPRYNRNSQLLLGHNVEEKIEKSYKSNRNKLIAFGIGALLMSFSGMLFYSYSEKQKNKELLNQELSQALKEMDKKIETKAKEEIEKRLVEERKRTEELEKKITKQNEELVKSLNQNSTETPGSLTKKVEEPKEVKKENTPSSSNTTKLVNKNSVTTPKTVSNNTSKKQKKVETTVTKKSTTTTTKQSEVANKKEATKKTEVATIPSNKGISSAISRSGGEMNKLVERVGTAFDDWMKKNNRETSSN